MSIFEYNEEEEMRKLREAEREIWQRRGKAEGKAEFVLELLEELGTVPDDLRKEILAERDLEKLSAWHKLAARCGTIEEFYRKR